MLHDDNFESDMSRLIKKEGRKEISDYVSDVIASYFEDEYEIDAAINSIDFNKDYSKGAVSVYIPEIVQDFVVPFEIFEDDGYAVEAEVNEVESSLGVKEYFVSVDGKKIAVKALSEPQALKKLESKLRKIDPEIADELQQKYLKESMADKLPADEAGIYFDGATKKRTLGEKNVIFSWHDFLLEKAPEFTREYGIEHWKTAVMKRTGKKYETVEYDKILDVIASEVYEMGNEDLKDFFNKFASEEIERRAPRFEEDPDISVEREVVGDTYDHIPSDFSVDLDMLIESEKKSSKENLNEKIRENIIEKIADIDTDLYLDNLMIMSVDKENRKVLASVTISEPNNFSVEMGLDIDVEKNGSININDDFKLIKGYYNLSEYEIPLNDNLYCVEASSKKEGIKKVLTHMIEKEEEHYSFDGRELVPSNVDLIAENLLIDIEDDINVKKTYSNVFEGEIGENPWEVEEKNGNKYLRGLYKSRKV